MYVFDEHALMLAMSVTIVGRKTGLMGFHVNVMSTIEIPSVTNRNPNIRENEDKVPSWMLTRKCRRFHHTQPSQKMN